MKMEKHWKRFFTLDRHHAEGFTLVELIVVIAILAILGGVAVPAYSGYVAKAELAGDQQLAKAMTTAFHSACIDENINVLDLEGTKVVLDGENKFSHFDFSGAEVDPSVTMSETISTTNDPFTVSFKAFYKENLTTPFKVADGLIFGNGMMQLLAPGVELTLSYGGGYISISYEDVQKLNESAFGEIGMEDLLGKVDFAASIAVSGTHDKVTAMVMDPSNIDSLAKALGYESSAADGFEDEFEELITQKAIAMAIADGKTADDCEDYGDDAMAAILANNAVLNAASNTTFDAQSFADQLSAGTAKHTINANLADKDKAQTALSQAAMAYAMYTAYATSNNIEVEDNLDLNTVLTTLDTPEFQTYMSEANTEGTQANADMDGYLASLNMIASSSSNKEAVSNVLVNGFTDAELIALLNQATSQTTKQD